jgi:hypothetical protein
MAGSKGELAGTDAPWFDCSKVPLLISGEMNPLIKVNSQARYILQMEYSNDCARTEYISKYHVSSS